MDVKHHERAEAVSNRGPSAYQPNALPLGQTGSQEEYIMTVFIWRCFLLPSRLTALCTVEYDSERVTIATARF